MTETPPSPPASPLPNWAKLTIHITILTITGVAALTQVPQVFTMLGLPAAAHWAGLVVTWAGLACAYVLRSPSLLGWLSLHDPDDVIAAESARIPLAQVKP
jgi:hypothetical protein